MVTLVAVGTVFISAGPSVAIWLGMLQRRAHLLVIAILSAFTWCVAIMLSSVVWLAIPPLRQNYPWVLFVTVTFQEVVRLLLYLLFAFLSRSSDGVGAFLRPGAKNNLLSGLAVGVGYALMSVLINYFSLLIDKFSDDTAIYVDICPINFFVAAASFAMAFSIMHILLGILVWPAYSHAGGTPYVILTYALHLAISEASLANRQNNGCVWGLGLIWGLVVGLFVITVFIARRRVRQEAE